MEIGITTRFNDKMGSKDRIYRAIKYRGKPIMQEERIKDNIKLSSVVNCKDVEFQTQTCFQKNNSFDIYSQDTVINTDPELKYRFKRC